MSGRRPPAGAQLAEVTRYHDVTSFLQAVEPALAPREAEHNLLWGVALARRAEESAGFGRDPIFLAHLGPKRAPRAVLLMTPPFGAVIAHLHGSVEAVAREAVQTMRAIELPTAGVIAHNDMADAFQRLWREATGEGVRRTIHERLHRARSVSPVTMRSGRLVVAGPEHFPLLVEWMRAFQAEAVPDDPTPDLERSVGLRIEQGDAVVWEEEGQPVGMAARARRTPRGICINAVYTPPEHRGKGVATSCVAELTRRLLNEAEFCVLFTDLANPTSNALYRRIGFQPVADFTLHWFARAASSRGPTD